MRLIIVALLASCISLPSHAEAKQGLTVEDIIALTQYERIGADREPVLRGMKITKKTPIGWVDNFSQRYIRTIADDEGVARHQVFFETRYVGGWRFYRGASLGGQALPFETVERRFSRCSSAFLKCGQHEVVTAELSRKQLEDGMETGLAVNFEAKKPGTDSVATFPPAYIMAYLIKLDGGQVLPSSELEDKDDVKPKSLVMAGNQ
jgi:hypothetical protein